MHSPQGFESYGEIQQWLKDEHKVEIPYHTVYGIVHDKCNAAPKVVRPKSRDQDDEQVTDFVKKYDLRLGMKAAIYQPQDENQTIRFWFP